MIILVRHRKFFEKILHDSLLVLCAYYDDSTRRIGIILICIVFYIIILRQSDTFGVSSGWGDLRLALVV